MCLDSLMHFYLYTQSNSLFPTTVSIMDITVGINYLPEQFNKKLISLQNFVMVASTILRIMIHKDI